MYHVKCVSIYPNFTSPFSTQTPKERPKRKHIKKDKTHTRTPGLHVSHHLKKKKKIQQNSSSSTQPNKPLLFSLSLSLVSLCLNQYLVASSFSNQPLKFIDFRCFCTKFFSGYRLNSLNLLYLLLSWSGYSYSFVGLRGSD